ncbi:MAG: hypothetical protein KDK99_09865 [Verrucomicrobiales bacterium]|nr:hypothetical protein [Verrucomicrobiales bacterium]
MNHILQIVPRVPPAVCGIGDYAWLLGRALHEGHDIHSRFLAAGTTWTAPQGDTEFPVSRLEERTTQAFVDAVMAQAGELEAVVLHMSPYGYQKRGVPLWLAQGWRRLSQTNAAPRLITMFHELYASGSPRTSAFWLQPLQKHVLRMVARASDGLRTNREAYAAWLKTTSGLKTKDVSVMPVFSNVGEPEVTPALEARPPAMIYFASGIHGGADADASMRRCCELAGKLGMNTLHVLGGAVPAQTSAPVTVVPHGYLPAAELSALLLECRAAFSGYHPLYLAKSGILAGFAAHGLAVILDAGMDGLPDQLQHGREFLRLGRSLSEATSQQVLSAVAEGLHKWYDGHSLRRTALSYAGQIRRIERGTHDS